MERNKTERGTMGRGGAALILVPAPPCPAYGDQLLPIPAPFRARVESDPIQTGRAKSGICGSVQNSHPYLFLPSSKPDPLI